MAFPKIAKITITVLLAMLLIGGGLYINRPESRASTQSTNDAYVQADFTMVAPQVQGRIDKVLVEDNQAVTRGQLLATIDDRDFVVAVQAATAQEASAQAGVAGLEARLVQQESTIRQAQAAVAVDEAALKLAKANQTRYRNLATDGSGTVQAQQQAEMQATVQRASMEKSQANLLATRQQVDVLKADLEKARAGLVRARAMVAAEKLKLSYTRITAPMDGTVGKKSVRLGALVDVGKPLLAIVPLDAIYISANYRETQLARVQPGQRVYIEVDALADKVLKGKVESIGPASGVSYSSVAPHNATGNFTKIVQRLPVRISIDNDQPAAAKLKVGMSVTPEIFVDD